MDSPKYAKFDISEVTYKVVNGQDIKAFIMIPKNTSTGKHPVMAKFHGGSFVTGASLYPDWFPQWALDYALLNSAIFIIPDYRLMPESTGLDIYEDLSDFWKWVRDGSLQKHLDSFKPGVEADLSKVLAYGESAGGTLAIQSGFTQPGFIKAVIATYPGMNIGVKRDRPIMGAPTVPPEVLESHLKAMVPGKIVTSALPPERMQLWLSMAQQERTQAFFGTDESLFPMKVLAKIEDAPFMLIMHGSEDTVVPVKGSYDFEDAARKKFGPGKVELIVQPGEHGFDGEATLESPWLKQGLEKVTKLWLG